MVQPFLLRRMVLTDESNRLQEIPVVTSVVSLWPLESKSLLDKKSDAVN
jgi:hypothetical protein